MEKDKNYKKIGVAAVLVAVLALSIAFAALSRTLTINGSGRVEASSWNIVWQKINGQTYTTSEGVGVETGYPILDNDSSKTEGTTLYLGNITLKKPGDYASYKINIKNKGDINGVLQSINIPDLSQIQVGSTGHYLSEYISIQVLNSSGTTTIATPRSLEAEEIIPVTVKVKFNNITNELFNLIPSTGLELSDFEITFTVNHDSEVAAPVEVNPANTAILVGVVGEEGEDEELEITSRYAKATANFDFSKVKEIHITNTNEAVSGAVDSWDASGGNNTVTASYVTDTDGKYKLYIGGNGGVYAPVDSSYLFAAYENLQVLDLTYLNTSNVINMTGMFGLNKSLTSLDLSNLDVSNVTSMGMLFAEDSALTSIKFGRNFDTSSVESMFAMFAGCSSIVTLNISSFDTANVTDMRGMFSGCASLETITGISNLNTSNVTSMLTMFYECESLVSLDLSGFNTSNVTDMTGMFGECTSLETITGINNFDTSNVTSMYTMFKGCSSLKTINLSGFVSDNLTNIAGMFENCAKLQKVDIRNLTFKNNMATTNIFGNINYDATIIVKDSTEKTNLNNAVLSQGDYTLNNVLTVAEYNAQ